MGTKEVLVVDSNFSPNVNGLDGDGLEQVGYGEHGREDLGDKLLVNLESYLDDINDRLLISRMVNDTVIKGMLNDVEQEAAEKIAAKDLEVASLKEFLQHCSVGFDKAELLELPNELESRDSSRHTSFEEACKNHDKVMESSNLLRNTAGEQPDKLKKGIDGARDSSVRRINSSSELAGFGGLSPEEETEIWIPVDKTLDSLKMTVDNIYSQANAMLIFLKSSICEWYWEKDLERELEILVMRSSIKIIQQEFEQKLRNQSAWSRDNINVNWIEKLNQVSNLRIELDAILKSLPNAETGQLISHGSHDADHFYRNVLSSHAASSMSQWEGNGKLEASSSDVAEAAQLKHMSKEDLLNHFNTKITKMRRDHESTVQQLIEERFTLKREYLKEMGPSLANKKDKEFDMLRKKISDVILKLDDILVQCEKLPAFTNDAENYRSLKDRLDNLLLENNQLRDSLRDRRNELKSLASQLSDASDKILQHSLAEANMLQIMGGLHSDIEDAHTEAALSEDLYKLTLNGIIQEIRCHTEDSARGLHSDIEDAHTEAALSEDLYKLILNGIIQEIRCHTEDSAMEILLKDEIYGIIYSGAVANTEFTRRCEIEDYDIESWFVQGFCEVIFKEALKEAGQEIKEFYMGYLMEEKEKVARDVSAALTKEGEQFELAAQELDSLREDVNQQRILVSDILKCQLGEALKQIKADRVEIQNLNQKLEQALKDFEQADDQRKMVLALAQEKHNDLQFMESKDRELAKQLEAVVVDTQGLWKSIVDFENKVAGKIKASNLRLEDSFSQLNSLRMKGKSLRREGLLTKERLEKKCENLRMAEAEVDLLGNEVDTLLNLLEKIYLALDHYSPVLQHYPGIMETLKLIRRELSGESIKSVIGQS